MNRIATIFIDGQAGTTGLQITERLQKFSGIQLIQLSESERKDDNMRTDALNSCDIAILCLPDDEAKKAVAMVANPAVKILDASSAHRTAFGWVYGLPEYNDRQADMIATAKRVSNPGCYPTGAILLLAPLVRNGIVPEDYPIVVHGSSGYSGGGKGLIARYEDKNNPNPIHTALRYYGLGLNHKHLPEMQDYCLLKYPPLFVPMVAPAYNGMVITIGLHLSACGAGATINKINEIYQKQYGQSPRIHLGERGFMPEESALVLEEMAHTDDIELFVFTDKSEDHALLVARYDNLGKGAAGASIQNLNLMLRSIL